MNEFFQLLVYIWLVVMFYGVLVGALYLFFTGKGERLIDEDDEHASNDPGIAPWRPKDH